MSDFLAIVAAVNDEDVLRGNLVASPCIAEGLRPLVLERGHSSAGAAYGAGLKRCGAEVVVFAHQDVYLPRGWDTQLHRVIELLNEKDANWAVLGVYGVRKDGRHVGHIWSSGLAQAIGNRLHEPTPVVSMDELVVIMRADSGITFDLELPGFHLYGTDIVQTAIKAGRSAYVFDGPVIHNSKPVRWLDRGFAEAYRHMQKKWIDALPLKTCVVPVTRSGWPLMRHRLRSLKRDLMGSHSEGYRVPNPQELAQSLGYELSPCSKTLHS